MERDYQTENKAVWLDEEQACSLLGIKSNTLRKNCRSGDFVFKIIKKGNKSEYKILLASLPDKYQKRFFNAGSFETDNLKYSEAPSWAKKQAEKYIYILQNTDGLRGKELKSFINDWNLKYPEFKTSYSRVNDVRIKYENGGVSALLAQYGKSAGRTSIDDKYFEYFKSLYMVEGAPSAYTCWLYTLGSAVREDGIAKEDFPSHQSFKRRLEREIPEQSIYLARYGKAKWNRKYADYIERDYTGISCGSIWVSDHAQLDVGCVIDDGRVCFPWVTAWRDFKSGKWLGWILQPDNPNSDHIFLTFYFSANEYGIPDDVIIDNGKDYRAKDFAGGRKVHKVTVDKSRTSCMLAELGINAHFALPYNAQTKPIERDFLKIKELFSKHMVGYRGGNVTERPEKLKREIKHGRLMPFNELKEIFDDFIENVFNKLPSQGKNLKGKSPDQLWSEEFKEKRVVSKDALKLFCRRTSGILTITRNGIRDSELQITYWSDWMIGVKGQKVYLRRDIKNYQEAWVFRAEDDEFIGKAFIKELVPALGKTDIEKSRFKEAIADKKRCSKIADAYSKVNKTGLNDRILNIKATVGNKINKENSKLSRIANTKMDKAVRKSKEIEKIGTYDLAAFIEEPLRKDKIYLFESDKEIDMRTESSNQHSFTQENIIGAGYGS